MLGHGEGHSRDVSEGGTFVLADALPPVGASIDLTIQLPAWQVGAAALRMEMTGEVIRVDVPPGHERKWGFAISSKKTSLTRFEESELHAERRQ
jgi:PilZ domain